MVYVIVLSLIAGALGLYYFLFKDLDLFKRRDISYIKPLPLVGNMGPSILRMQSVVELLKQLYNVHLEAKYIGFFDMTKPVVIMHDPNLIKSIALKHFDQFPDHRSFVQEDQDPLFSRNLFSLQGNRWREMRTVLSPAFTSSKMKNMFKLMSDCVIDFANFVMQQPPEQRVIEAKDIFTRYTSDVIATYAFGVSVDSMQDPKNLFYVYGRQVTVFDNVALLKFYIFRSLPWLAKILQLKFIPDQVAKFFYDLVETTIKTREEKGIVRPDMLQLMMESRGKKEGRKDLTIEEMTCQTFSFFFDGFDSTSTLMCFAAHEITVNQNVQKRLQNEIDQVLEDTNGQAPYDAVNSMEYLDAVVSEALRIYPVSIALDRLCVKDFELPSTLPGVKPYTIKKGQGVWIPVYALHHDPKYFEEPEKFNPDRFLGEQKKQIINTGAYLPFGLGPTGCASVTDSLCWKRRCCSSTLLLARCDLLPCEKTPIPLELAKDGFNMKAKGGFWLKVVPRKNPHCTVAVNNVNSTCAL